MSGKEETEKLKRKEYEKKLHKLQVELCYLQDWIKESGERVIIVLEGRDAAGKGGTIKAITERVSPRVFRVVALPAPSDREKSQMYMQRYVERFPGRRRDRDLRPELVQPRRRRIRHGLLLAQGSTSASSNSALPSRSSSSTAASGSSRSGWRSARRSRTGASGRASTTRFASGS